MRSVISSLHVVNCQVQLYDRTPVKDVKEEFHQMSHRGETGI